MRNKKPIIAKNDNKYHCPKCEKDGDYSTHGMTACEGCCKRN